MVNLIVEISKYIIIILMAVYTYYAFRVFGFKEKVKINRTYRKMSQIIFLFHFICYLILFLNTHNLKVLILYSMQLAVLIFALILYQWVYVNLSKLILHNMLFMITIGFVMLTRLSYDDSLRQFYIVVGALVLCLIIPILIDKMWYLVKFGWIYGIIGVFLLLSVLFFGVENYGATNWIIIGGITFQPSEFVKIVFVFCIASLLAKRKDFRYIVVVTVLAAIHVLILVLEKDLGGALIFFITYLVMLFVATSQPLYFFSGLIAGCGASYLAYHTFNHVRVRVAAWRNPWALIDKEGYQVSQSLFAIGTGGWFGMGLSKGLPTSIPVVESDFIFSAISEELGGIFALCLVLICLSCFIMFINIAMKLKDKFYKLVALGLSIMYIFQVFLSIGGVIKFIPSTGVTLPLISSGGSSILSSIILFSVIQGLYVKEQDRNDVSEKKKRRKARTEEQSE